jgi:Type ISP C-terminal specificity domain
MIRAEFQVGTGITTLLKKKQKSNGIATVLFRDFWGHAAQKRQALLDSVDLDNWPNAKRDKANKLPEGPRKYEQFVPTVENRWKLVSVVAEGGYEEWPGLDELFPFMVQGVNPNRGLQGSIIEIDRDVLEKRMHDYFSAQPYEDFAKRHPGICEEYADYNPRKVRESFQKKKFQKERILPYVLFPLDVRWIYYETESKLLNRPRPEMWDNLEKNEFFVTVPQPRRLSESLPLLATSLYDLHVHDRGSVGFPAEIKPEHDLFTSQKNSAYSNLTPEFWDALKKKWNLKGDLYAQAVRQFTRSLFRAVLAICHSPQYQLDHRDSLAQDWAHIPIPKDKTVLDDLAESGEKIAFLLNPLLNADRAIRALLGNANRTLAVIQKRGSPAIRQSELLITFSYYGAATGRWCARHPTEKEAQHRSWGEQDLFLNEEVYFANVPEKVWQFELGGYPVLKKWLGYRDSKRRSNQPLSLSEAAHFRSMVQRIATLLVLHEKLDQVYEQAASDCFSAEELQVR